ncbi:enhancer of rudimentary [Protomyces lactucae-debilis]|uniref:Enhancer of rudimentary n=1 Tax=Protomyces lactucae-debilis TaxID=2754530 RepID=A0A1Y2F3M4_PROLT|nr:enhancer of rudimentary [Protomyces lactucae-debilis]ORY78510.1 enhancer of rudimentary [Protomyces lactucae-debilis]
MAMNKPHTLLMFQKTESAAQRTWSEHSSADAAVQYIIGVYAGGIARRNPHKEISTTDVLNFVDQLHDVVAMVYDSKLESYVARDSGWLKKRISGYWEKQDQDAVRR